MANVLAAFQQLAMEADQRQQVGLVFQNPALLSPVCWPEFKDAKALELLRGIESSLRAKPAQFPFPAGPVDAIWFQVNKKQITQQYAESLAAQAGIYSRLSPVYVFCLAEFCYRQMIAGRWRDAVAFMDILFAAIQARTQDAAFAADQNEIWAFAVMDFIEIAGRSVNDIPDGRLFQRAAQAGERLAQQGPPWLGHASPAEVLHRMGALHLDTYVSGRTTADFAGQIKHWMERLPGQDVSVPAPLDAFRIATQYFHTAVEAREGVLRGVSLKGCGESLFWRTIVADPEASLSEAAALMGQAVDLLQGQASYESQTAQLNGFLQFINKQRAAATPPVIPDGPLEDLVRRMDPGQALAYCNSIVAALAGVQPEKAVAFWRRMAVLVAKYGTEHVRVEYLERGVGLIADAWADKQLGDVESLRQRAAVEKWSSRKLAVTLLWFAAVSSNFNQELAAWPVLQEAQKTDAETASEFNDLFCFVGARLHLNAGVTAEKAGDRALAAQEFALALGQFLELNMPGEADRLLHFLSDLAVNADAAVAANIVIGLSRYSLRIEDKLPLESVQLFYQICQLTFSALARLKEMNTVLLLFLWQVAKGYRYSAMLRSAHVGSCTESTAAAALLSDVEKAAQALPGEDKFALLDDEDLLGAYLGQWEREPGANAQQVYRNLQGVFDDFLDRCLVGAVEATDTSGLLLSAETIRQNLDAETVLVSHYIAETADGKEALYTLLLTREDVFVAGGWMPQGFLPQSVKDARRAIQDEPGPRSITTEAADNLDRDRRNFLGGPIPAMLDKWRQAGKNHLLFVPHGALQFYPYHLMGSEDAPLAQDWVVSCLPSITLLLPRLDAAGPERLAITALGLEFAAGNAHGLPPLVNSCEESKAVAGYFGMPAILNQDATEAALIQALKTSRRVHLSTHGYLPAHAPSFHCLFLTPDSKEDGLLRAYELLRLDLRHVELVTLSACESALGRFDIGDNLRGLPAFLLLAGVRTIVATLWPVEPETAEIFFRSFYQRVSQDAPVREAFAVAQRETREARPQYRDWGAFYLMGRS